MRDSCLNLPSQQKNTERRRATAKEGRTTQSDLGRLEQQELSTESTWIDSGRSYQQALDNFKRQLGITLEVPIVLDGRELEALRILDPDLNLDDSIRIALAARLDYLNVKEQLEDAERKVKVAA